MFLVLVAEFHGSWGWFAGILVPSRLRPCRAYFGRKGAVVSRRDLLTGRSAGNRYSGICQRPAAEYSLPLIGYCRNQSDRRRV